MIIYGWRSAHLRTTKSQTATCPSCNTKGSTVISVYSKHAHIFWIPLFPYGKTGASQCQHCKYAMKLKEMPEEIKKEYKNLKMDVKPPIWQFAGLILFSFLVVWLIYAGKEGKKMDQEYLAAPAKGDIYEFKTESGYYSTLKVMQVTADSVIVSPNNYEMEKKSRLYKIEKPENYAEFTYGISKENLKKMYEEEEIFDIER